MTCLEKYKELYGNDPEKPSVEEALAEFCPSYFGIMDDPYTHDTKYGECLGADMDDEKVCMDCWNREVPDKKMTCLEKYMEDYKDDPEKLSENELFNGEACPNDFGYALFEARYCKYDHSDCIKCWNREVYKDSNPEDCKKVIDTDITQMMPEMSRMKVICISGKAQHGKDTTAGFMKTALEKQGMRVLIAHYGDLLKYICKTFFGWNGKKDEMGRTILQNIGTNKIRKQNPDYWVKFITDILLMFKNEWDYVLIPDTRFPNEIQYLRDAGLDATHIKVYRPNFENPLTEAQRNHISEIALDDVNPDLVLWNGGTLSDLQASINRILPCIYKPELNDYAKKVEE